jgi:hypothetical protein
MPVNVALPELQLVLRHGKQEQILFDRQNHHRNIINQVLNK